MKFTLVPAGSFLMGSDETRESLENAGFVLSESFDPSVEHPPHSVRITRPFYLGTFEVTRGQFAEFVTDSGHVTDAESDGEGGWGYDATTTFSAQKPEFNWRSTGFSQTDSHPVVNITWHDATAFCEWLSRKERKTYRLPTEAEWEYACQAGATTQFATGDSSSSLQGYGNMMDAAFKTKFPKVDYAKSPIFEFDDGWAFTAPVGRFKPNPFGLHDMHGNVWEWCSDWYSSTYYATSPAVDPAGATSGSSRVSRGGGWELTARSCRSAFRYGDDPSFRSNDLGFRVALSPSGE
jgi:sulfatase modifying factor 1